MDKHIINARLNFSCDADWSAMENITGGKHCQLCKKNVYDLTNYSQDELIFLLAENNYNICGKIKAEQVVQAKISKPIWKKWLSAAMVLLGINLFSTKTQAQSKAPIKINQHQNKNNDVDFLGIIGAAFDKQPEFPGGPKAFENFLSKNIQYKKGSHNGRVVVTFTVKKNGSLADFKVVKKLYPINDNEVIRVLKLSPKWKPALLNKKAIDVQFSLPVKFQV